MKDGKKYTIVITANDVWRFIGAVFVVLGYIVDKEKTFEASFGDISFKGELLGILGLALVFMPIFTRGINAKR